MVIVTQSFENCKKRSDKFILMCIHTYLAVWCQTDDAWIRLLWTLLSKCVQWYSLSSRCSHYTDSTWWWDSLLGFGSTKKYSPFNRVLHLGQFDPGGHHQHVQGLLRMFLHIRSSLLDLKNFLPCFLPIEGVCSLSDMQGNSFLCIFVLCPPVLCYMGFQWPSGLTSIVLVRGHDCR